MKHFLKSTAIALSMVFMFSATLIPATVNLVEAGKLKKTFKKAKKGTRKEGKKAYGKSKWAAEQMKKGTAKGAKAAHKGSKKVGGKLKKRLKK